MRSDNEHKDVSDGASYRELQLLSEIERDPEASQRELARRLGSALGMTNYLLRNLAQKGYIRVSQAGWKRWFYAVTPAGFARKVQLTVSYIQRVLGHYGEVRQTLREVFDLLPLNSESKVAVYGVNDFAELVFLGLKEVGVDEIDFYSQDNQEGSRFLGMPVRELGTLPVENYDLVILAHLGPKDGKVTHLLDAGVPPEKVVTFFSEDEVKASKKGLKTKR